MSAYDVVVIGTGPGGYVAAIRAAQQGAKVACIEREELGGVCLNWGCIPTKTLIHSAELFRKLKHASDYGLRADNVGFDMAAILKRKREVVRKNKSGIAALFKAHGIELIKGEARVVARGMVDVDGSRIDAKSIIIATGSGPAQLPGLETDGKQVITSTEALELTALPAKAAIIGAGALGAEFACIWSAFGVEVTLIELLSRALPREDEELSKRLGDSLKKKGIDLRTGTKVAKLERGKSGVALTLEGDAPGTLNVDLVLVGIGRKYHSEVVTATPELGVQVGPRGEILVDDRMETSVPGIYAIGDVVGKTLLAHGASSEGLVAAANATGGNARMNYRVVPSCNFTSPEVASVGLTEAQARETGVPVQVGRFNFLASGRAHAMGETEGMVKIVGDARTHEVLGVHIMGAEAGELIASAAVAMTMEATVEEIAHTIHTHPTLSETVMEAAEDFLGKGIHTPPAKRA